MFVFSSVSDIPPLLRGKIIVVQRLVVSVELWFDSIWIFGAGITISQPAPVRTKRKSKSWLVTSRGTVVCWRVNGIRASGISIPAASAPDTELSRGAGRQMPVYNVCYPGKQSGPVTNGSNVNALSTVIPATTCPYHHQPYAQSRFKLGADMDMNLVRAIPTPAQDLHTFKLVSFCFAVSHSHLSPSAGRGGAVSAFISFFWIQLIIPRL